MCFWSSNMDASFYCHESRKDISCTDCTFCEECELCYECIDCTKCYNCNSCQDCKQCIDCELSFGCTGCSNCYGCVGLQRKQFYIFNKPYSKADYFQKITELKQLPREELLQEFEKVKRATPLLYMHQLDNENSFGDYLSHSKNSFWCFDSFNCEDSMYIFNANLERGAKDSADCGPMINTVEQSYDIAFAGFLFNCQHIYWCDYLSDSQWCSNLWNSQNCFGCVYMKNKQYHFLNKPLPKEEYENITSRLSKELREMGIIDLYDCLYKNIS